MSSTSSNVSALVPCRWLKARLADKMSTLRLLDGSFHKAVEKRNPRKEYNQEHIPGSLFFDIDECADHTSRFEHMLPTPRQFECYVGDLGIRNDNHVVVYDNNATYGLFSAQRVWWMFRVFGHDLVSVLDGGLPKWKAEGHSVTNKVEMVPELTVFKAGFRDDMVKNFQDLEENILSNNRYFTVFDARREKSFNGISSSKPGIKPGHMPAALHVPFPSLLDPDTKVMKSPMELMNVFKEAGVDINKPLVASCGSGVTACMLALAAYMCGQENVPVYDGSWEEWYHRARPEHKINVPNDENTPNKENLTEPN